MDVLCLCLSPAIQRTLTFESFSTGSVNRSASYIESASGKGLNSARVLNQLQIECSTVICPVGKLNKGHFKRLAARDDLFVKSVKIPGLTRVCWTCADMKNHQTTEIVADETASYESELYKKAERKILKKSFKILKKTDALLAAGSTPKYFSSDLMARVCERAANLHKTVLCDFRGKELLRTLDLCNPDIIKINESEFCQTFEFQEDADEEELAKKIAQVSTKYKNIVVVTRGAKKTIAAQCGRIFTQEPEKVTPVNTTACGDSFSAGFLYEYVKTRSVVKALEKGTWCAARNAELIVPGAIK